MLNGMSLVKVRPFGSGFFIFSDYARGAIRLSALMELPVIIFSLTIRSASVRTARRTSRWSISPRCAPSLDWSRCGPGRQ